MVCTGHIPGACQCYLQNSTFFILAECLSGSAVCPSTFLRDKNLLTANDYGQFQSGKQTQLRLHGLWSGYGGGGSFAGAFFFAGHGWGIVAGVQIS